MITRDVNLERMQAAVDRCCKTEAECGTCPKMRCLVGFCQTVLAYCREKHTVRIPQGNKVIPRDDLRVYYQPDLIQALVEILLQCQGCRDNHEEECVINLTRNALELALLGENFAYKGSALVYLMEVSRHNPETGAILMKAYQEQKTR